jgi:4-amino-4-deoxy-L-arabinose transferase-like glycosyltransferase
VTFDWLCRHRAWVCAAVAVALFAQMAVGMVTAAREQTPTTDEPVYVGAAVVYLQQHSLRYNYEHPPLAKLVMATGLAFAGARVGAHVGPSEWDLGRDVLYQEGNDAGRLMFLARLPMIILTMLFGVIVFLFARDLVGTLGGLVALTLYAFSPDILGYGSLAGMDVPMAGFLLTTFWLLWRSRARPYRYLPLAGLALGAAIATKMSALAAVPLAVVLVLVVDRRPLVRRLAAAAGVVLIAIAVVWVVYLVVDPQLRWSPRAVQGLSGHVVNLLPFPRPFRDGLRYQLYYDGQPFSGFLIGDAYVGSKWYYLPVALAIKEPIGLLVLGLAGVARPRAWPVLVPAAFLLAAALYGARDFGVRYAVFVPMFLAVAAAFVVTYRARWAHVAAGLLLVFVAASSLRTFPYYVPYSNEAFGGPAKTYLWLSDSNVDWGQDLGRLADLLHADYPGQPIWLVYKGGGAPAYYGITARDPLSASAGDVRGLLAVSSRRVPTASGRLKTLLDSSTRVAEIGHSIFLYRR